MKTLWDKMDGYKTYAVAGIMAAITFSQVMGWITKEQYEAIMGFLGALGLYAMRDGIKKMA